MGKNLFFQTPGIFSLTYNGVRFFFQHHLFAMRGNVFQCRIFFPQVSPHKIFFPLKSICRIFFIEITHTPSPPPQYHSFSFQLLVFAPFPLGKGIVLLSYQTKFALCSVSSFATHFAHLPPLKVSSRVKNHNFSKFAIFK